MNAGIGLPSAIERGRSFLDIGWLNDEDMVLAWSTELSVVELLRLCPAITHAPSFMNTVDVIAGIELLEELTIDELEERLAGELFVRLNLPDWSLLWIQRDGFAEVQAIFSDVPRAMGEMVTSSVSGKITAAMADRFLAELPTAA